MLDWIETFVPSSDSSNQLWFACVWRTVTLKMGVYSVVLLLLLLFLLLCAALWSYWGACYKDHKLHHKSCHRSSSKTFRTYNIQLKTYETIAKDKWLQIKPCLQPVGGEQHWVGGEFAEASVWVVQWVTPLPVLWIGSLIVPALLSYSMNHEVFPTNASQSSLTGEWPVYLDSHVLRLSCLNCTTCSRWVYDWRTNTKSRYF